MNLILEEKTEQKNESDVKCAKCQCLLCKKDIEKGIYRYINNRNTPSIAFWSAIFQCPKCDSVLLLMPSMFTSVAGNVDCEKIFPMYF